jgi:hypothetical protein
MRKGTVPGRLTAQRKPHFGTHVRPWTIDFVIGYYRDHVDIRKRSTHGFAPIVDFFSWRGLSPQKVDDRLLSPGHRGNAGPFGSG